MTEGKKNIVFIVNPKAGITPKSKLVIELMAGNIIPSSKFILKVIFTEYAGHATEIARDAIANGADILVASGGDGTVNEVAFTRRFRKWSCQMSWYINEFSPRLAHYHKREYKNDGYSKCEQYGLHKHRRYWFRCPCGP